MVSDDEMLIPMRRSYSRPRFCDGLLLPFGQRDLEVINMIRNPNETSAKLDGHDRWLFCPSIDLLTMGLLLGLFVLIYYFPEVLPGDVVMYLHCGRSLLEGQIPYVDLIDGNPPAIMYFSVLPAVISSLVGLKITTCYSLVVTIILIWTTVFMRRLIAGNGSATERIQVSLFLLAWVGASVAAMATYCYGQRDHLIALVMFPYLLLRALREQGQPSVGDVEAGVMGVAAGLASCFKPQYIVIIASMEMFWAFKKKPVKIPTAPEFLGLATALVVYHVHFAFVPEEMKMGMVSKMLLMQRRYDVLMPAGTFDLLKAKAALLPLASLLLVPAVWPGQYGPTSRLTRLIPTLLPAVTGGLLVYLLSSRGFCYQGLPAITGSLLIISIFLGYYLVPRLSDMLRSPLLSKTFPLKSRHTAAVSIAGVSALVGLSFCWIRMDSMILKPSHSMMTERAIVASIIEHTRPGDQVIILSQAFPFPWPFFEEINRRPGTRFLHMQWFQLFSREFEVLSAAYRTGKVQAHTSLHAERFLTELTEDVYRRKPGLILVDNFDCGDCHAKINVYDLWRSAASADDCLKGYERLPDVILPNGSMAVFRFKPTTLL
ncbi:MAG: hypothetical protein V2B18_04750 [Pseudomonadota bacterium]